MSKTTKQGHLWKIIAVAGPILLLLYVCQMVIGYGLTNLMKNS